LLFVYFLMFLINLFLEDKQIKNFFSKVWYFQKMLISLISGIFSSGPLYIWYDFLKMVKEKWFTDGNLITFMRARAIKLPLLAAMVAFLWLKFTLFFNLTILIFAIIAWLLFDFIASKKKDKMNG
jgi:hypothetical protein